MEPRVDPDRQIEEARASLVAHLGELRRRISAVRARLDAPAHIAAHPLASVGAAFALGALLGMRGGRRRGAGADAERSLASAVVAGLAALAVRLAKELAMRGAAEAAREWWEQRPQASASELADEPGAEPYRER